MGNWKIENEKKFEHAIVTHPFLYDSRSDVFSFIVN